MNKYKKLVINLEKNIEKFIEDCLIKKVLKENIQEVKEHLGDIDSLEKRLKESISNLEIVTAKNFSTELLYLHRSLADYNIIIKKILDLEDSIFCAIEDSSTNEEHE